MVSGEMSLASIGAIEGLSAGRTPNTLPLLRAYIQEIKAQRAEMIRAPAHTGGVMYTVLGRVAEPGHLDTVHALLKVEEGFAWGMYGSSFVLRPLQLLMAPAGVEAAVRNEIQEPLVREAFADMDWGRAYSSLQNPGEPYPLAR